MTENEAIEVLRGYDEERKELEKMAFRTRPDYFSEETYRKFVKAIEMSMKSLKELQQYRSIGTVSECREAMEKQRAKKYERGLDKEVRCPICGTFTTDIYEHRFCSYCGQRLE